MRQIHEARGIFSNLLDVTGLARVPSRMRYQKRQPCGMHGREFPESPTELTRFPIQSADRFELESDDPIF